MASSVTTAVLSLIQSSFDETAVAVQGTTLGERPEIHTGRWSRAQTLPAIAIHSQDGGVIDGGDTGASAFASGSNAVMQKRGGSVTVDCVAGTRNDTAGLGADGSDLNPKAVRDALEQHLAEEILLPSYATPPEPLRTVSPGDATDIEQTSDEEDVRPVYLKQLRVRYTRFR